MLIRPYYIIYAIFAYTSCVSDAIIYSPMNQYTNTDTKYQPGRALGELFGGMVLNAIKRNQMQQAELDPKDVHDIHPEYDNGYSKKPSLEGVYERARNDDVLKADDLGYNDRYNSRGSSYDDRRYQVNSDIPASRPRPDRPSKDLDYVLPPINGRASTRRTMDEESYAVRGVDGRGRGNNYQDSTSELRFGVDEGYQTDRDFVTRPKGIPNRVSQPGYEGGRDDNVPLEPLIPPRQEEVAENDDVYKRRMDDNNDKGKLKTLTVKKFTFPAQPVRPESERNISTITVYYMD